VIFATAVTGPACGAGMAPADRVAAALAGNDIAKMRKAADESALASRLMTPSPSGPSGKRYETTCHGLGNPYILLEIRISRGPLFRINGAEW
jgi:hypothetical protein